MCQDRTIRIVLLTYRYFGIPLLRTFLRISGIAFTEFQNSAFTDFSPLLRTFLRFYGILVAVEYAKMPLSRGFALG